MIRIRFYPLLMVATVACSDTAVGPYPAAEPADDGFETVAGMVLSPSEFLSSDGQVRTLIGPKTAMLRELIGAELRIRGTADELGSATLWIVEFQVLSVDGLPALDGILELTADGYAIRNADGDLIAVGQVPDLLAENPGKRVWMTWKDGNYVRYGFLEEPVDRKVAPNPRDPHSARSR